MEETARLFTPLKTKRVFEEIADQIRELIYSGHFKPGDKLPSERELANQFKAGRMVVREALRTLEHAGLIYIKQGSFGGAFIKESDAAVITRSISDMIRIGNVTLKELTETRIGIEMVILESVFRRINQEDLEALGRNVEEAEKEIANGNRPLETNLNFHVLLARASKNTLFEMIIKSIMAVTTSFLVTINPGADHLRQVLRYHKEIYQALAKGDFEGAERIMKEHLLEANKRVSDLAKEQTL
jgi:DNA-binding FadR family transcriptional regulator